MEELSQQLALRTEVPLGGTFFLKGSWTDVVLKNQPQGWEVNIGRLQKNGRNKTQHGLRARAQAYRARVKDVVRKEAKDDVISQSPVQADWRWGGDVSAPESWTGRGLDTAVLSWWSPSRSQSPKTDILCLDLRLPISREPGLQKVPARLGQQA